MPTFYPSVYCPYCGHRQTVEYQGTQKAKLLKIECGNCRGTWIMGDSV